MKPILRSACLLAFICSFLASGALPAHAWGNEGHEIVGAVADLAMKSPQARAQVKRLLGDESLSRAAIWADVVKSLGLYPFDDGRNAQLARDRDTVAFVKEFSDNGSNARSHAQGGSGVWHFVDLPLGSTGYDEPGMAPTFVGTPRHEDIVMRLQDCIRVLRSPAQDGGAWGKHNALRMLVHLVGDIHQPLHVGSAYLDPEAAPDKFIVSDPAIIKARHFKSDQGGNMLLFGSPGHYETLHGYWDVDLVEDAMAAQGSPTVAKYAQFLAQQPAPPQWNSTGPLTDWPAQWTGGVLAQARLAYSGVHVLSTQEQLLPTQYSPQKKGYLIKLDDDYEERMDPVVQNQLAQAGFRLAQLLDAIWPAR
jgi:hypothetical protein